MRLQVVRNPPPLDAEHTGWRPVRRHKIAFEHDYRMGRAREPERGRESRQAPVRDPEAPNRWAGARFLKARRLARATQPQLETPAARPTREPAGSRVERAATKQQTSGLAQPDEPDEGGLARPARGSHGACTVVLAPGEAGRLWLARARQAMMAECEDRYRDC